MHNKTSLDNILKRHLSISTRKLLRRIRKYLVAGFLVTAPIAITLYLTYVFVIFIDQQVAKMLPGDWQPEYGHSIFPGSGILITVGFFIVVGWLATNFFGRVFIEISEYIMVHVPFIRPLYSAVKQIVETLMGSQAKAFREVVMIEYPRKGSWTLGFVTGNPQGEIKDASGNDIVTVFVPTAPSPVNGFMLFIPRSEAIPMKMTIDEGIKMIVSMGILMPPDRTLIEEPSKDKAA